MTNAPFGIDPSLTLRMTERGVTQDDESKDCHGPMDIGPRNDKERAGMTMFRQ